MSASEVGRLGLILESTSIFNEKRSRKLNKEECHRRASISAGVGSAETHPRASTAGLGHAWLRAQTPLPRRDAGARCEP